MSMFHQKKTLTYTSCQVKTFIKMSDIWHIYIVNLCYGSSVLTGDRSNILSNRRNHCGNCVVITDSVKLPFFQLWSYFHNFAHTLVLF